MIIGLLLVFLAVLALPFLFRRVEHNLEIFLLVMGLIASLVAGIISPHLWREIFANRLLYLITGAVLIAGLLFRLLHRQIRRLIEAAIVFVPLKLLAFLIIVILGLGSSFITAIISALLLVEIIGFLPLPRRDEVRLTILCCFSIGFGAALTPVGEPLSTIVVSKLGADFWYLARTIGLYILPTILGLGLLGAMLIKGGRPEEPRDNTLGKMEDPEDRETFVAILVRAGKIFLFIIGLELLGAGFRPLIDQYVIHWDGRILYWAGMTSAILDNATLAAAEISRKMDQAQIQAILMGLLISGGMLIPGNIPNIIAAGRLKIRSSEWARVGVPLGLALLVAFFILKYVL